MDLRFCDTLSRKERTLSPTRGRPLQMYVCGPTVYSASHVGHARAYLVFDTVRRFFLAQGQPLRHIQNITDFEDKITRRAIQEGISWEELSRREARGFFGRMGELNVLRPDATPASSHYVRSMIALIRRMERKGYTYTRRGAVYFDASRSIGSSNFSADEFLSAHAVPEPGGEALPEAEDPRDFVLWKPTRPPAPSWPSPWSRGMPGWHIECYAMASRYLDLPMDLHGGGLDLIFPHHYAENLISTALRGTPFAQHFLHNAFVTMDARKMAKSTGSLVTIREALETVSPGGLRSYLLSRRYDQNLEYSTYEAVQRDGEWELDQCTLVDLVRGNGGEGYPVSRLEGRFDEVLAAVGNHLGTNAAMRTVHEIAEDVRRSGYTRLARGERTAGRRILARYELLLGLPLTVRSGAQ